MLNHKEAVDQAKQMLQWRQAEADKLERIYKYMRGKQPLPAIPNGVPNDVKRLAQMSRVNMVKLVLDVPSQSLFVDGYRGTGEGDNDPAAWAAWQANRMDARQSAVHRAALGYGVSYVRVLPGTPTAVIKGASPRYMTTVYGEDEAWPLWALERIRGKQPLFRLYDDEGYYVLEIKDGDSVTFIEDAGHDLGVTPVVRFRNIEDLDDEQVGEVEPLIPIQDQIDKTTFDLLVAQHYQSFRQRYIIGWTSADEDEKLKAGASRLWTFEDDNVKVGEFGEVNLAQIIESRESAIQQFATLSQTPPHHLLGKLVNLSAEALVAAESGQRRKLDERETSFGESWEQTFGLVAIAENRQPDESAQVRWRDTEARAFAATVDGLAKLAQSLKVPVQMLWERIPGWTQQDTDRATTLLQQGSAIEQLLATLADGQTSPEE